MVLNDEIIIGTCF